MDLPATFVLPLPDARLRAVCEDDWRLDLALSRDADVPLWTYYPADLTPEQARERVARSVTLRADGRGGRFVVELEGAAVGAMGVVARVDGPYVHYALLPAGRGRGLATVGVRALAGWILDQGAADVRAQTMTGNAASERVLERAHFRRDGLDVDAHGVTLMRWRLEPTVE